MATMMLSKLFSSRFVPAINLLPQGWQDDSADQVAMRITEPGPAGTMLNIGAAFVNWWKIPPEKRTVLRVNQSTAQYLSTVGINYVPVTPPAIWNGQGIVVESAGGPTQPLVEDIFSIAGYFHFSTTRLRKELYVVWLYGQDAGVAPFPCGEPKVMLDAPLLKGTYEKNAEQDTFDLTDVYPGYEKRAVAALRMLLAASYYAEHPQTELSEFKGPLGPASAGGVGGKKKYYNLWTYKNLTIPPQARVEAKSERTVDGLSLSPVLVRPYIRLQNDKPTFVHGHSSHRWKTDKDTPDPIGTKTTI